jgi:hypothetical protein
MPPLSASVRSAVARRISVLFRSPVRFDMATGVARVRVRVAAGPARLHYSLATQASSAPRRHLPEATFEAMAGAGGR